MFDNTIHSFYQAMIGQIHDPLALESFRWFPATVLIQPRLP
jgi:hypothetical protein